MANRKETPSIRYTSTTKAIADVEVISNNTLNIEFYYGFNATTSRYGGCLVTKDTSDESTISPATANSTAVILGMTYYSIQDKSGASHRLNPFALERDLGELPGVIQGKGQIWLRRFVGTVLPNDKLIAGPSGYAKAGSATEAGTVIGISQTSGIGDVDSPGADASIRVNVDLPAYPSGLNP